MWWRIRESEWKAVGRSKRARASWLLVAFSGGVAIAACGSDADVRSSTRWECQETASECLCFEVDPDTEVDGSGRTVSSCLGFDCCLLSEPDDGSGALCTCYGPDFDCAAQASVRRDTTVVDACPLDPQPAGACAAIGESCDLDYLDQERLQGCCDGSVCDLDDAGVRACRAGTSEDVRRARECSRAAYSADTTLAVEQGTIQTSTGAVTLAGVQSARPLVGAGGCVQGIEVTLVEDAAGALDLDCSLRLVASPVGNELGVTAVDVNFGGCAGYTGPVLTTVREMNPANIPFEAALDMISCDWGGGFEGFCTSGRAEFRLLGSLGGIEFSDSTVALSGVACVGMPAGECLAD